MMNTLKVVIVGAGLGGLACAISCRRHGLEVVVLERTPKLGSVGAGIQVPPNATRVMRHLGLYSQLESKAIVLDAINLRRYKNGTLLGQRPGGERMIADYGSPWMVIHREDYQRILWDKATKLGVDIWLGADATGIDFERTSVTLSDGRTVLGDVIVGADGLWSTVRPLLLSQDSPPVETGDLAYRATFDLEQLLAFEDPRIHDLVFRKEVNVWLGPGKHSVFYPVRGGKQFNLVLLRPDNLPEGSRTVQGDLGEMRETFEGWDDVLTKIISCISSVLKWKLCHHKELQTWVKNSVALLGDSCHPTLPYQAQGAAMAVEDGAVLGELLGLLCRSAEPSTRDICSEIPSILQLYQSLRKSRTTLNVQGAIANQKMYHMADGPDQEARDKLLKAADWQKSSAFGWADSGYQKELLAWDAVGDCREKFTEYYGADR